MNPAIDSARDASHAVIEVVHLTRYDYDAPVALALHLAHLRPRDDASQRLQDFELRIEPPPGHLRSDLDRLGNPRSFFTLTQPHRRLEVRARSRVRVDALPPCAPEATLAWEAVRDRLRYAARAPFEAASEFAFASPFVPALPALQALARPSFAAGRPIAAAAIDLMRRIHADFAYRPASTEVDTPLAEVLQRREGVCQDFAHLMIGAMRSMGLAARYISGYLLTSAPEPGATAAPLLGADASHAWVSVWCPMADGSPPQWLKLDPTNNVLPGVGHVRLAIGRDYSDVTPLRGVIRGSGAHRLEVRVRTRRVLGSDLTPAETAASSGWPKNCEARTR